MDRPGRLFCFGLGYAAGMLAEQLAAQGWHIAGTTRNEGKLAKFRDLGFAVYPFERARPLADPAGVLAGTTHLLLSVPPDEAGDPVREVHGADIAGLGGLRWAGYLSTTGVYGDTGGAWVDEDSPLQPTADRARRRVAAEAGWRDLAARVRLPLHVFRLAGIYGPGRSTLDRVRDGTTQRIDRPGHVLSRIHVGDIAAALTASMARPGGGVYNLCDDEPAAAADVVVWACTLLGVAPPPLVRLEQAGLSPMAQSFYADNRRVCNRRLKDELGIALAYPDYRSGLRAILEAEGKPGADDGGGGTGASAPSSRSQSASTVAQISATWGGSAKR